MYFSLRHFKDLLDVRIAYITALFGGFVQQHRYVLIQKLNTVLIFKQACIPVGCVPPAEGAATRCQYRGLSCLVPCSFQGVCLQGSVCLKVVSASRDGDVYLQGW